MTPRSGRSEGVLAIDIGGTKISGAILDLECSVIYKLTVPSRESIKGIADPALIKTKSLIAELMEYAKIHDIKILRGAAGFPEYVNLEGELTTAENVDWRTQPKEDFAELSGFPWEIESDVRCAGLAEARFGAGIGKNDFVYLTISSGISHTHFLDGEAVTGLHGEAIGFGLIEIDIDGTTYELEKYCSGLGISRRYALMNGNYEVDAKLLMELYERDQQARSVIDSATNVLGKEMARFVASIGTEKVVIGGGLWLGSQRYRQMTRESFAVECKNLKVSADIENAKIENSGVIGAAIYAIASLK